MKIIPYKILKSPQQQKTVTSRKAAGNEFQDILKQATDTASKPLEGCMTSPPVQNVPAIHFDHIPNINKAQNIERVEQFLNVLENYHHKLGDPDSTLKEFHPLVADMESETARILPLLDSISDGDELKSILNRAVITATVEVIKFNRGDYL